MRKWFYSYRSDVLFRKLLRPGWGLLKRRPLPASGWNWLRKLV